MTVFSAPISTNSLARGHVPADDLVRRLCSSTPASSAGPLLAGFQSIISFGLLPLILWPMRWASYVDVERNDLLELMSRWRSRVAPTDARQLDQIARRLRPRPILMVLPWLVAAFTGVLLIALLSQGQHFSGIWDLTFGHGHELRNHAVWIPSFQENPGFYAFTGQDGQNNFRLQAESHLFDVWTWGLMFAYACHWYAVRSHARTVDALVNWTNRLATTNHLPIVRNESLKTGLSLFWIILAIVLCASNAWWGIPLALGGAMQQRYSRFSSIRIRTALGCQLRDGFALAMATMPSSRFCGSAHCGARLPAAANFCPRCGSAAVFAQGNRV